MTADDDAGTLCEANESEANEEVLRSQPYQVGGVVVVVVAADS